MRNEPENALTVPPPHAWPSRTFDAVRIEWLLLDARGRNVTPPPPATLRIGASFQGGVDVLAREAWERVASAPRYAQFLDQAFEWSEMTYSFTQRVSEEPEAAAVTCSSAGEDESFSAFLQAGFARLLLPVNPRQAYAALYFLASGTLWDGPDDLTPANDAAVTVVDELKSAAARSAWPGRRSEPWTVLVPTGMVMLQEGPELPRFESGRKS